MVSMCYLSALSIDPTEQIRYTCHMSARGSRSWQADAESAVSMTTFTGAEQVTFPSPKKLITCP
jgi:hypothetical protein